MEKYECETVLVTCDLRKNGAESSIWKPLLRQSMISIGIWYIYFMQGLFLGAPTVIVAQIRREANSTDAVTDEMSSWLASTPVISSVPQMIILPWLFHQIGRKFTYLIVCTLSIISFMIFYFSTSLHHVLISQIFLGTSGAAVNSFTPIIISEYTSPKYRGIFLTLKSASTFWGIWVSNAIGTFFYWKNIAIVSFVCSIYVLTILVWPESPYWLATKGRYLESSASHRWLKGTDENSEKELAELINSQKKSKIKLRNNIDDNSKFSKIWSTITNPSFYKPTLICMILMAQYHLTGKFVISIYAIDVLKNITHDESAAYKGMLILDGVTVFSMYVGCILSRYCKRRLLMFLFGTIGSVFMYTISFYLYLVSISYIEENHILTISLLMGFSIATGCGPMILASSIYGELIPASYQRPIMVITGFSTVSIMSTSLKISPFMFKALKMHGSFLFYAVASTTALIILYMYLPETKDKTIQAIEQNITGPLLTERHEKFITATESK